MLKIVTYGLPGGWYMKLHGKYWGDCGECVFWFLVQISSPDWCPTFLPAVSAGCSWWQLLPPWRIVLTEQAT